MTFTLLYKVGPIFKYRPNDTITANSKEELIKAVHDYTNAHKADLALNLQFFSTTRIECDICYQDKRIGGYSFRIA